VQGGIFLVIAAISALYWRRPAIFMYVLLGTLLADLLSLVIRYAIGRDRPPIDYPDPVPLVRLPDNPSFPSGHAATCFAAAAAKGAALRARRADRVLARLRRRPLPA
jgi:membrane-associated phospholipid phosphatase